MAQAACPDSSGSRLCPRSSLYPRAPKYKSTSETLSLSHLLKTIYTVNEALAKLTYPTTKYTKNNVLAAVTPSTSVPRLNKR